MGIRDRLKARAKRALGVGESQETPLPTWRPEPKRERTTPSPAAVPDESASVASNGAPSGSAARPSRIPPPPPKSDTDDDLTLNVDPSELANPFGGGGLPLNAQPRTTSDDPDSNQELQELVVEQIKTVFDPEIPVNIWELGLIYLVTVNGEGELEIKMTLTSPNCPAAQSMPEEIKKKCEAIEGIEKAEVIIVWEPQWGPDKMTEEARLHLNF